MPENRCLPRGRRGRSDAEREERRGRRGGPCNEFHYGDGTFANHAVGMRVAVDVTGGGANQLRGLAKVGMGFVQHFPRDNFLGTYTDGKIVREVFINNPAGFPGFILVPPAPPPPPPPPQPTIATFPVRDHKSADPDLDVVGACRARREPWRTGRSVVTSTVIVPAVVVSAVPEIGRTREAGGHRTATRIVSLINPIGQLRYAGFVDLFAEVVALTAALDAAAIDYAICGGVALAIHGAPRATKDIDLLAREADLARLRDVVRARGFTLEALPMTFSSSGISIRRFTKIEPDGRTLMVDVLIAEGALASVWQTRARVEFEGAGAAGTRLWVVSRAGLISLKLTAGRPQDIVDIQRLEEVSHGEHDT